MGWLGGLLMLFEVALVMITEEELLLGVKVVTSSTPPSSEDEGTGEDESDEVVEGVRGQTTSFLSFRSSICRGNFYISEVRLFSYSSHKSHLQLCGNHGLDGVNGVGQFRQGLGSVLARTSS